MRGKSKIVAAALAVLGFVHVSLADEEEDTGSLCRWDSGKGASFDLSRLQLKEGGQLSYYTVRDKRAKTEELYNFSYSFNICNQVINYPSWSSACKSDDHETCVKQLENGTCIQRALIDGKAFSYQMRNDDRDKCRAVAGSDADKDVSYSLLNSWNPAEGLNLIYTGGEYCEMQDIQRNREFHVKFVCDDDEYNIPDEETVLEDVDCIYEIIVKSVYGCPTECGTYSNMLCGNNGLCDYDWTNTKAKCYCYWGWTGSDCSQIDDSVDEYTDDRQHEEDKDDVWVTTFDSDVTYKDSEGNIQTTVVQVTYDLGNYHFESNQGQFQLDSDDGKYIYYFNLFGNVKSSDMPAECVNATAPCDYDNADDCVTLATNVGSDKKGSIFQIGHKDDGNLTCNLIGTYEGNAQYAFMQQIDSKNPTEGVQVVYNHGGYCQNAGRNRQMIFDFICPDSNRTWTDQNKDRELKAYVTEPETCKYAAVIESAFACPWQCISEDSEDSDKVEVCGGRGMCAADPLAKSVRCLCNDGYSGTYCTEVEKGSSGGSGGSSSDVGWKVAISVVSVLVALFIAATVWLYLQNQSLKQYSKQFLEDEPDDVVNPQFHHSEPKVPDDLVDSDSGGELDSASNDRMTTSMGTDGGFGHTEAEEVHIEMEDGTGQIMPNSPIRNEDSYEKEELVND